MYNAHIKQFTEKKTHKIYLYTGTARPSALQI